MAQAPRVYHIFSPLRAPDRCACWLDFHMQISRLCFSRRRHQGAARQEGVGTSGAGGHDVVRTSGPWRCDPLMSPLILVQRMSVRTLVVKTLGTGK